MSWGARTVDLLYVCGRVGEKGVNNSRSIGTHGTIVIQTRNDSGLDLSGDYERGKKQLGIVQILDVL